MEIQERSVSGVTLLNLTGSIVLGESYGLLKKKVHDLLRRGRRKVVLNLGGVPYLDTTGLSEIIGAYTTLCRHNDKVVLLNPTPRARHLFTISKLLTVFEIVDSEEEALRSFVGSPECSPVYRPGRRNVAGGAANLSHVDALGGAQLVVGS